MADNPHIPTEAHSEIESAFAAAMEQATAIHVQNAAAVSAAFPGVPAAQAETTTEGGG